MTKRGLSGQLNLFDFWGDTNSEDSIVEMVSLMPEEPIQEEEMQLEEAVLEEVQQEEPVQEAVEESARRISVGDEGKAPVMHKEITDKKGNVTAEISYLNYNKVYIQNDEYGQGRLFEFENSKDAVDFYITEMTKLTGEG